MKSKSQLRFKINILFGSESTWDRAPVDVRDVGSASIYTKRAAQNLSTGINKDAAPYGRSGLGLTIVRARRSEISPVQDVYQAVQSQDQLPAERNWEVRDIFRVF